MYKPINLITEFITPVNPNFKFIFIGDTVSQTIISEFKEAFRLVNAKPKMSTITTHNLYNNKIKISYTEKSPRILYFDKDLSKDMINIGTNNGDQVDELDNMLIWKFIMKIPLDRIIFDTSESTPELLAKFLDALDGAAESSTYYQNEHLLAIIIPRKPIR